MYSLAIVCRAFFRSCSHRTYFHFHLVPDLELCVCVCLQCRSMNISMRLMDFFPQSHRQHLVGSKKNEQELAWQMDEQANA